MTGTWRRWAGRSLDARPNHFLFDGCQLKLFRTRREARVWIEGKYGYIRNRPDLQIAPHNWRVPKAVRVTVTITEEVGK